MIIDSHHHLWRYTEVDYGWIGEGMQAIARSFSAEDLEAAAASHGVVGSVAVQARQTVEETDDLLQIAEASSFVRGVVGWAPLAADDLSRVLDGWAGRTALRGLRHVVQDEPDDNFLDGEAFNQGVAEIIRRGLRYDVLIFARQLPAAIRFVDRHPDGLFVLDHIAKPDIKGNEVDVWRERINEFAGRPNTLCKISGVVTEADWSTWTPDTIRPYLDAVLEAFGPSRLMFGSDWPVCLLATGYERWVKTVSDWASALSEDEKAALFWRTACNYYGIEIEE